MSAKTRLFLALWVAGFLGVASTLLIDFDALIALIPLPAGTKIPHMTVALKLLSLIQPSAILALAVFAGVTLTPKVGLHAPMTEAVLTGGPVLPALQPQLLPGLLGGIVGGIAVVLLSTIISRLLPPEAVARVSALGKVLPVPMRLLYGGITEELLLRWGLMTFLTWGFWRWLQKRREGAPSGCYHAAIFISAVIFGAAHLPLAFLIVPHLTPALVTFVIVGNGAFGVIAGYLFWKRGLESAIVAHMVTHVVLLTASRLGAYF